MSSRRFRSLELGKGPLDPAIAAGGDTDVCRRCGAEHRAGEVHCQRCGGVLGGPGQDAFDDAFHARQRVTRETPPPSRVVTATTGGTTAAGSVGGVLSAAALTACVFALISIPVRLVFAAANHDPMPGRAVFELLVVVGITLAVRRLFAEELSRL